MYNGDSIDTVIVSEKFQVVIPKNVRERLKIRPGERIVMIEKGGVISLVPVGKITELRGTMKGIDTKGVRDESERID